MDINGGGKMKILALDLSTRSTGWSLYEDSKLINYGCITVTDTNFLNRISKMTEKLKVVFDEQQPDTFIVEEVLPDDVKHNQQVFKALMYLQAAVAIELNKRNKKMEFFTASEWRKRCGIQTGRGITRDKVKAADIKFVKDNYNLDVNDDVADAICIGYAYTNGKSTTIVTEDGFEFK